MRVTVKQEEESPVPREVLADAIVAISKAMRTLSERSRLNRRAIAVLLNDLTGLPKRDINLVLNSIESLEESYVVKS